MENSFITHMWRFRILPLLAVAASTNADKASSHLPGSQQPDVAPLVVLSGSERRWASVVGLMVLVRDVDQPDSAISDVRVVLERPTVGAATPLTGSSDASGMASVVASDSGEYRVRILRVGYERLHIRVRLAAACQQILEVYIPRVVGLREAPVVTAPVGGKPATPKPGRPVSLTAGRAVLTTCPPAA